MATYYGKNKKGHYGFFDNRVHKIIDKDWIKIDRDQYLYLLKEQSKGNEIVHDDKGFPTIRNYE